MNNLDAVVARVEKRTGKSFRGHLGWGKIEATALKYFVASDGYHYIGESDAKNWTQGIGIKLDKDGNFFCNRRKDNKVDIGNAISIHSDGDIRVGEDFYDDNGNIKARGTHYNADGTTEKFDIKN